MKRAIRLATLLMLIILTPGLSVAESSAIDWGNWSREQIDTLIKEDAKSSTGQRIERISQAFLGTPYLAASLIGSSTEQEQLVIRLDGFDCFTFIDTVEALRRSQSLADFRARLQQVRYRDSRVDFLTRRHFFSDWAHADEHRVRDVTGKIGRNAVKKVEKVLNRKTDGSYYLKGYPPVPRTLTYLPSAEITPNHLEKMHSGDYLGIYTDKAGLDVTHVGIVIKKGATPYFRHASSSAQFQQVIDSELSKYLKTATGIIILRPL